MDVVPYLGNKRLDDAARAHPRAGGGACERHARPAGQPGGSADAR